MYHYCRIENIWKECRYHLRTYEYIIDRTKLRINIIGNFKCNSKFFTHGDRNQKRKQLTFKEILVRKYVNTTNIYKRRNL